MTKGVKPAHICAYWRKAEWFLSWREIGNSRRSPLSRLMPLLLILARPTHSSVVITLFPVYFCQPHYTSLSVSLIPVLSPSSSARIPQKEGVGIDTPPIGVTGLLTGSTSMDICDAVYILYSTFCNTATCRMVAPPAPDLGVVDIAPGDPPRILQRLQQKWCDGVSPVD